MKLDFSATNFKAKVTGWRLSVEKKANTLFPTVCDTARNIAGVIAATADSTRSEHLDPQILARANLASEDEEDTAAEHEKDDTQVVDEDHRDRFDEHHDDRGNNNGGDDLDDGCENKGDDENGEGGNGPGAGSEEDEDSSDGKSHNNNQEERFQAGEASSILTDIDSSSDASVTKNVQVVHVSGSHRKKGVQRG